MKILIAALAGGAMLQGATLAAANSAPNSATAARPLGVDARIPFAATTGIRNFQADGDNALWIEGQRGEWYRAELFGPCIGLDHAMKVGFIPRGTSSLDRFGQVAPRVLFTADGYFYNGKTIDSLAPVRGVLEQLPSVERVVVTSTPPPAKVKKAKAS